MAISKIGTNSIDTITSLSFAASQTASADANTFDDYEEGLYTATFTCGTSGTIAINSSYDQMSYTKVGRIVTVTGSIVSSTVSSPVGSVKINLPFTIASQTEDSADFAIAVTNSSLASNNVGDVQGNGSEGDAFVELTLGDSTNPQSDLANQYSGNETLHLGFTYIAA
jgi:hypothetical protein